MTKLIIVVVLIGLLTTGIIFFSNRDSFEGKVEMKATPSPSISASFSFEFDISRADVIYKKGTKVRLTGVFKEKLKLEKDGDVEMKLTGSNFVMTIRNEADDEWLSSSKKRDYITMSSSLTKETVYRLQRESDKSYYYTTHYKTEDCRDTFSGEPQADCNLSIIDLKENNLALAGISISCYPNSEVGLKNCDDIVSKLKYEFL